MPGPDAQKKTPVENNSTIECSIAVDFSQVGRLFDVDIVCRLIFEPQPIRKGGKKEIKVTTEMLESRSDWPHRTARQWRKSSRMLQGSTRPSDVEPHSSPCTALFAGIRVIRGRFQPVRSVLTGVRCQSLQQCVLSLLPVSPFSCYRCSALG